MRSASKAPNAIRAEGAKCDSREHRPGEWGQFVYKPVPAPKAPNVIAQCIAWGTGHPQTSSRAEGANVIAQSIARGTGHPQTSSRAEGAKCDSPGRRPGRDVHKPNQPQRGGIESES